MDKIRTCAIILSAGRGSRMKSKVAKQYIEIDNRPIIYYTLRAFEDSIIDDVVLVAGAQEIEYCRTEIIEKYNFKKVINIVEGGAERFNSVYNGLRAVQNADYVFIHDGARPFVTADMIERGLECVKNYKACVFGMPVKDTIKIIDEDNNVVSTPVRSKTWLVQTPQMFEYDIIKNAYERLIESKSQDVTDDAMVAERYADIKVKLVEGSYENIKITTPEDLEIAKSIMVKNM